MHAQRGKVIIVVIIAVVVTKITTSRDIRVDVKFAHNDSKVTKTIISTSE